MLADPKGFGSLKRLARGDPQRGADLCAAAQRVLLRLPAAGIARSRLAAEALGGGWPHGLRLRKPEPGGDRRRCARRALRYHGDFDWPGLRIGNWVMRRFGAQPWRFRAQDYLDAAFDVEVGARSLGSDRVTADWDSALAAAMQARNRAVDEEAVADRLLDDLAGSD